MAIDRKPLLLTGWGQVDLVLCTLTSPQGCWNIMVTGFLPSKDPRERQQQESHDAFKDLVAEADITTSATLFVRCKLLVTAPLKGEEELVSEGSSNIV